MKAILEFNLPEESQEHQNALKGTDFKIEIEGFDNYLRAIVKYDNFTDFPGINEVTVTTVVEIIRMKLHEYCENSLS